MCRDCGRLGREIADWGSASQAQRLAIRIAAAARLDAGAAAARLDAGAAAARLDAGAAAERLDAGAAAARPDAYTARTPAAD